MQMIDLGITAAHSLAPCGILPFPGHNRSAFPGSLRNTGPSWT